MLSGTPALARPEELYPQLAVLAPKIAGSFSQVCARCRREAED